MQQNILRVYRDAWAYALALPGLFLIPFVAELAQHIAEMRIGFYQPGMAAALAHEPHRMGLGFIKTLALLLPPYWFVRYMAGDRDAAAAQRIEQPAISLFAIQFLLGAAFQGLMLFDPPLAGGRYASLALSVTWAVIGIYLTAWFVAWPLGNRAIGPIRSFSVMRGSFLRTLGYRVAGTLPLMLVHYALNYAAVGRPVWQISLLMTADATCTGFLALTMAGASYVAAQEAAARACIPLVPRP